MKYTVLECCQSHLLDVMIKYVMEISNGKLLMFKYLMQLLKWKLLMKQNTINNNDSQLLKIGTENEETINTMDTEIKIERDVIDGYEFKGTVSNIKTIRMNSDKTCYSRKKPLSDICDKNSKASNLTKYTTIYNGAKPYKCDIFNKYLFIASLLKTHTRKHTGEIPYKCDICDHGYFQKSHFLINFLTCPN